MTEDIASKVAWSGELEFAGAAETDRNGRTVTFRIVPAPADLSRPHPFQQFTRRRGKRVGTIFQASITAVATAESVYADELMLAGWADGPQGRTVSFWLSADGATHPFLGYRRASRDEAGTRFMAAFVERQDDGTVVDEQRRQKAEAVSDNSGRRQQTLSNAVTLVLKNPRFHDWLREHVVVTDWNYERANNWLKEYLGIDSKSELDDSRHARAIARWEAIRERFVAWQDEQGDSRRPF